MLSPFISVHFTKRYPSSGSASAVTSDLYAEMPSPDLIRPCSPVVTFTFTSTS
ncbi:hypothetical protein Barb6_02382 [Bacteroidales bacterium Barb6]|nr:hypothetical protein Barb6_02382 [Bacteroidales bacterium Barb6]